MPGSGGNVRALLAVALVGMAACAQAPVARAADAPLQLVSEKQVDPRYSELVFKTPYLDAPTQVRLLKPAGYDPRSSRRYPVLYLLHGCCDDYRSWIDKGQAEQLSAPYPMFVVMPDASADNTQDGWYTDWYNDGAFGNPRWESYHVGQLIPWIDEHYKTVAARRGRAVAGLSMGGFGTMSYAARHPDLFAAAAAFSGATDTNDPAPLGFAIVGQGAWGSRSSEEVRWRAHNPVDLAENLRGMNVQIRTGDGTPGGPYDGPMPFLLAQDAIEIAVHRQSVNLHDRLGGLGIKHVWQDYGAGSHDWPYWARDLKLSLPIVQSVFASRPAAPSPFDFKAAEPDFGAFGWKVHMKRDVMEFAELSDASTHGFALTGSGTGEVTTAASYKPRRAYDVRVSDDTGTVTKRFSQAADSAGRLHISVPLGASNTTQDYTLGQPNAKRTATVQIERSDDD